MRQLRNLGQSGLYLALGVFASTAAFAIFTASSLSGPQSLEKLAVGSTGRCGRKLAWSLSSGEKKVRIHQFNAIIPWARQTK